jgi:AAA15 family ATPase/GTPase
MNIKFTGEYKSINNFEWNDIPSFVVITGPNGSGKSHLLQLINNSIANSRYAGNKVIINEKFSVEDVFFLQGEWKLTDVQPVDLASIKSKFGSLYNSFKSTSNTASNSLIARDRFESVFKKILAETGKSKRDAVSKDEFESLFPEFFIEEETLLGQKISEIFYRYRLEEIQLLADGIDPLDIVKHLGEKPWVVLRHIIKESKLPFTITDPSKSKIIDTFNFEIMDNLSMKKIKISDLSSGEKVIISLVFYLYSSQEKKVFPKLLLLDEPDAHLHPSMSQQFLNVVKNVLVDKYNVRVIMTTHSPSTVILAPEESIYEMSKEEPRIRKSPSKNHSVSLLTAGLVYVGEGTKYFLVEDKDDVDFYSYVYNQLVLDRAIDSNIPLVFIPASTNTKSGGKDVVQNWVKKLEDSGLQNVIHGLIDEDSGNVVSGGVHKINRYSIENYLIDPLMVFATLLDKEKAPVIDGVKLAIGEEYKLKTLPNDVLQKIVDHILDLVEPELSNSFSDFEEGEKEKVDVMFTNEITLSYPKWIITRRGKTMLNEVYNRVFKSPIVNFATLFKAMRKLNIFPLELLNKFNELKSTNQA